jgi:hypothetical protein
MLTNFWFASDKHLTDFASLCVGLCKGRIVFGIKKEYTKAENISSAI